MDDEMFQLIINNQQNWGNIFEANKVKNRKDYNAKLRPFMQKNRALKRQLNLEYELSIKSKN